MVVNHAREAIEWFESILLCSGRAIQPGKAGDSKAESRRASQLDGHAAIHGEMLVAHDFNPMVCIDTLKGLFI
jgi:hypothetical protein